MVPGVCYLIMVPWALKWVAPFQFIDSFSNLTIYSTVAYAFLAYLIGFISDSIAIVIVLFITDRIRGDHRARVLAEFMKENTETEITDYHFSTIYSFVDIKAPNAREKADMFSAMSGLARNLSLAFLLLSILILCTAVVEFQNGYLVHEFAASACSFVVSCVLMLRADTFRKWSHSHLLNSFSLLGGGRP